MTNPKRLWKTLQLVKGLCVVDSRTLQHLVRTRQSVDCMLMCTALHIIRLHYRMKEGTSTQLTRTQSAHTGNTEFLQQAPQAARHTDPR